MKLLDPIESQLVANRLPLVGVTVAAVPYANTPVVLTLHWHGFVETKLADVTDANVVAYQPVPSSALQVNDRWDRHEDLEHAILEVAWELGAWDLARQEARPFIRPGGTARESFECMNAFGQPPVLIEGQPPVVAEVPDGDELIETISCLAHALVVRRRVSVNAQHGIVELSTMVGELGAQLACVLGSRLQQIGRAHV